MRWLPFAAATHRSVHALEVGCEVCGKACGSIYIYSCKNKYECGGILMFLLNFGYTDI